MLVGPTVWIIATLLVVVSILCGAVAYVGVFVFMAAVVLPTYRTALVRRDGLPGTGVVMSGFGLSSGQDPTSAGVHLRLLVQAQGIAPYEVSGDYVVHPYDLGRVQPGCTVDVAIDRADPMHVALMPFTTDRASPERTAPALN